MPRITIRPTAYIDLVLAIDICPVEVSGLGDVAHKNDVWDITSVVVIPQRCGRELTHFDPVSFNRYLEDLAEHSGTEAVDAKKLWWHSHVYSTALFSGTDVQYIEDGFGRNVPRSARNPWLVSVIGNKCREELNVRLDIFRPYRRSYAYGALSLYLSPYVSRETLRKLYRERGPQMEAIIKERVTIASSEEIREKIRRGGKDEPR